MSDLKEYLLVKRGLYYRPNNAGYTGLKSEAGRYPESYGLGLVSVTAVHESEAPEYSPACWEETKIADLQAKLDKAVEALGDIENPISYLEKEAEKAGAEGLNSNAVVLAKDYAFLQLLATNALAAIKGSSHD